MNKPNLIELDLPEIGDKLNVCYSKLQFLSDVFCLCQYFELTERSQAGLFHILDDVTSSVGEIHSAFTTDSPEKTEQEL